MNLASIKVKLFSLGIAVSVLMLLIMVLIIPPKAKSLGENIMQANAVFTANLLAENLALGMQTILLDDGASLEQTLQLLEVGGKDGLIERVSIFDENMAFVKGLNADENYHIERTDSMVIDNMKKSLSIRQLMKDMDGAAVGYVEVVFTKKHFLDKIASFFRFVLLLGFAVVICLCVVVYFVARSIVRPVNNTIDMLKSIASGEGDLTKRLDIYTKDEIGELSQWFNTFIEKLQTLVKNVVGNVIRLSQASDQLSSVSSQMASNAEEMTAQSSNVAVVTDQMTSLVNGMASASEEMSVNVSLVASAADQMSQEINSAALAVEEMTSSISNISHNARTSMETSKKAIGMADTATSTMDKLGVVAKEIGNVTAVIKRIAEQTNLLALNATIQAASAGEAGKGFAVVANEIKELAEQSALAAEDIAKRVGSVQGNTDEAVEVIADVSKIINDLGPSFEVITEAVEQQNKSANDISASVSRASNGAREIAVSIAEVAKGSKDMSQDAGETARGANDVASNIRGVNDAANESSSSAQDVDKAASELAIIAGDLQKMVGKFKID